MALLCYVNGRYLDKDKAQISIDDRACQFGDGVYEVVAFYRKNPIDEEAHLDRLAHSLAEIRIDWPVARRTLVLIIRRLLRLNDIETGLAYIQISRGVAPRDHSFPKKPVKPSLIVTTRSLPASHFERLKKGVHIITKPDLRWKRPDIKTLNLLPNCLAKQEAIEAGVDDVWFVNEKGQVTEGGSSNAWIVTRRGKLVTHPASQAILRGITRNTILSLARQEEMAIEERPFQLEEALEADEAFISSALSFVTPVRRLDSHRFQGQNPFSEKLQKAYQNYIEGRRPDEPEKRKEQYVAE